MIATEVAPDVQQELFTRLDGFPELEAHYGMPSYVVQWQGLELLRHDARIDPAIGPLLVDYAARPDGPLMVRAWALKIGVSSAVSAVQEAEQGGVPATEEQTAIYNRIQQVAPEYLQPNTNAGCNPLPTATDWVGNEYFEFFGRIARSDGIDLRVLTPDVSKFNEDHSIIPTQVPDAASLLLRKLIDGDHALDINHLSPDVARGALELALDFRSDKYGQAVTEGNYVGDAEFFRLWRLTKAGGEEHKAPVDFLYRLPEAQRTEYARTFSRLYESADGLRDVFPEELGDAIVYGARGLLANALFAAQAHVQNGGQTHSSIMLTSGSELPVDFTGDEVLQTLQQLSDVFTHLRETVLSNSTRTVPAAMGSGFQIDRFIDIATGFPPSVSLYTRPYEADAYDDVYEYGRPGRGVEASISYKVQVGGAEKLSPIGKYEAGKDIISIRLDREHNGVISLDVGSILGNPSTFGTKAGRLLAWGNTLRAKALDVPAGLNHIKNALDQRFGEAAAFAKLALGMRKRVARKRASTAEFQIYASRAAGYKVPESVRVGAAAALAATFAASN